MLQHRLLIKFILKLLINFCIGECVLSQNELENNSKTSSIGFIIIHQQGSYHKDLAKTKEDLLHQSSQLSNTVKIGVYDSYEDFSQVVGHWTILPIVEKLSQLDYKWLFFLEDVTSVNLKLVLNLLSKYKAEEDVFMGHGLKDIESTIIHHYDAIDENSLLYPHFSAGFVISQSLMKKLIEKCENCHFSIDAKYELAKYIWQYTAITLQHREEFCLKFDKHTCASWIDENYAHCGETVSVKDIQVAVKTCQKFHNSRVPVVQKTWAPDVAKNNLLFFSDADNPYVPTVKLNVANVESGHCLKTLSILKNYASRHELLRDWLLIADDDTLVSLSRLQHLLSCYNSSDDVALGERYGYNVASGYGYNYLTGGSGMVFSRSVVLRLASDCSCPSADSPDDMIIGLCLLTMGIPLSHSPLFHQARPVDYSKDYLSPWKHISFHKHWMIDPYETYNQWLKEENVHTEL